MGTEQDNKIQGFREGKGNRPSDIRALRITVSKERGQEMKTGNTVTAPFLIQRKGYTGG